MKTNCSDWYRSWGFGNNKLGTLETTNIPGTYLWEGHCQGRHGQIWNMRSKTLFSVSNGEITIIEQKGCNLPDHRDVLESVRILETPKPEKKVRKRLDTNVKQLTFDI